MHSSLRNSPWNQIKGFKGHIEKPILGKISIDLAWNVCLTDWHVASRFWEILHWIKQFQLCKITTVSFVIVYWYWIDSFISHSGSPHRYITSQFNMATLVREPHSYSTKPNLTQDRDRENLGAFSVTKPYSWRFKPLTAAGMCAARLSELLRWQQTHKHGQKQKETGKPTNDKQIQAQQTDSYNLHNHTWHWTINSPQAATSRPLCARVFSTDTVASHETPVAQ